MIRKTPVYIKVIAWILFGIGGFSLQMAFNQQYAFGPVLETTLSVEALRGIATVAFVPLALMDYLGAILLLFNIGGKRDYWWGMFIPAIATFGLFALMFITGDMQTLLTMIVRVICFFILNLHYKRTHMWRVASFL